MKRTNRYAALAALAALAIPGAAWATVSSSDTLTSPNQGVTAQTMHQTLGDQGAEPMQGMSETSGPSNQGENKTPNPDQSSRDDQCPSDNGQPGRQQDDRRGEGTDGKTRPEGQRGNGGPCGGMMRNGPEGQGPQGQPPQGQPPQGDSRQQGQKTHDDGMPPSNEQGRGNQPSRPSKEGPGRDGQSGPPMGCPGQNGPQGNQDSPGERPNQSQDQSKKGPQDQSKRGQRGERPGSKEHRHQGDKPSDTNDKNNPSSAPSETSK